MQVPFLDLQRQYQAIQHDISEAIGRVMDSQAFSGGPFVTQFEEQFAAFCDCPYAVGVASGTAALWLSLLALDIGLGDEVITVPNTFIATAAAIHFCGARPVFVDVDDATFTMNPTLLAEAITERTKAVIPVHLFGQTADMDPILAIAAHHGLFVIEDACQAPGASYKGMKVGTIGDAGCFSFYPGKNLGAYGEAGMVVTTHPKLAQTLRALRDHGQEQKYHHALIGWNARMDGLQAAVLSLKLRHLDTWNTLRRSHAQVYRDLLKDCEHVMVPTEADYAKHVYHIFALRVPGRDTCIRVLAKQGISCGIHYPVPIHLQPAFRFLGLQRGRFPVTERCAEELLSLPMFPELQPAEVQFVSQEIQRMQPEVHMRQL